MQPPTTCAKRGDVHVAYRVIGEGEHALKGIPGAWRLHGIESP